MDKTVGQLAVSVEDVYICSLHSEGAYSLHVYIILQTKTPEKGVPVINCGWGSNGVSVSSTISLRNIRRWLRILYLEASSH